MGGMSPAVEYSGTFTVDDRIAAPMRYLPVEVPAGTSVTFSNPAGNTKAHCVVQFYEGLFSSGPIQPGQSFSFTFKAPGEYFYNDCADPRTTGKVIVY